MINRLKKVIKYRLFHFTLSVMHDEMGSFVAIADQVHAYRISSERERQRYYDDTRDPITLKERFIVANII